MNKPDPQLDQLLSLADDQLRCPTGFPAGVEIRRLAQRRRESRQRQRQATVGVLLLACGLFGWRWLMPTPQPVAESIHTQELLAEVADIRQRRQRLDDDLSLLQLGHQLRDLQSRIQRLQQNSPTLLATYRRNHITWSALQQVANETNADSKRWQLETLATGYFDTTAGMVAQSMLNSNQTPDSFFRELQ